MSARIAAEAAAVLALCGALAFLPIKAPEAKSSPMPAPVIAPPIGNEPGVGEFKLQPETCLVCNGTGVTNGLTCYLCKGVGRVPFSSTAPPVTPPSHVGSVSQGVTGSSGLTPGGGAVFVSQPAPQPQRYAWVLQTIYGPLGRQLGYRRVLVPVDQYGRQVSYARASGGQRRFRPLRAAACGIFGCR